MSSYSCLITRKLGWWQVLNDTEHVGAMSVSPNMSWILDTIKFCPHLAGNFLNQRESSRLGLGQNGKKKAALSFLKMAKFL